MRYLEMDLAELQKAMRPKKKRPARGAERPAPSGPCGFLAEHARAEQIRLGGHGRVHEGGALHPNHGNQSPTPLYISSGVRTTECSNLRCERAGLGDLRPRSQKNNRALSRQESRASCLQLCTAAQIVNLAGPEGIEYLHTSSCQSRLLKLQEDMAVLKQPGGHIRSRSSCSAPRGSGHPEKPTPTAPRPPRVPLPGDPGPQR